MAQARTEFAAALNQVASEKGVDVSVVVDAIKQAALAAYRKDLTLRNEPIPEDIEEYTSEVNPVTGEIAILKGKENVTPPGFARIAASIARQVIMQRLHEAEKGAILAEYETKIGTIISGAIQRQEGNTCFIDLGRAEGMMPPSEQIRDETYHPGLRMKFYIKEIREDGRGPEVILSRSDPNLVKGLFAIEVPEIQSGSVEVKVVAREAGSRTKIAAVSKQDGVDPVGSLVGQKGVRVQAVMQELGDEKIDIISYSDDPARFIVAALSPAKDIQVSLNEEEKIATVTVPSTQMSLAIGKGGQNVRLAAKLTGWKIDIEGSGEPEEEAEAEETKAEETPKTEEVSAETEVTDPSKTPGEAVTEVAEENATTEDEKEEVKEAGEVVEEKEQLKETIGEAEVPEPDTEKEDKASEPDPKNEG